MLSFAVAFAISFGAVCASDQMHDADVVSMLQVNAQKEVSDVGPDGNPIPMDSDRPQETPVAVFTLEATGVTQDESGNAKGWECFTGWPTDLAYNQNGHVRLSAQHASLEECQADVEGKISDGKQIAAMSFNTKYGGNQCDYWLSGMELTTDTATCCTYWTTCIGGGGAAPATTTTTTTPAATTKGWECFTGWPTDLAYNQNGHVRLSAQHASLEECQADVEGKIADGKQIAAMSFNTKYGGNQCDYWLSGMELTTDTATCCTYWTTCIGGGAPPAATTATTTLVDLTGLDEEEKEEEIEDEKEDVHECAKWCYSKKHKNKPWTQKCEWFACSTCEECTR